MIQEAPPGKTFPLGATVLEDGVNFAIFSKHADRMELLLFDSQTAPEPSRIIKLDAERNRSYHYWHTYLPGITSGQVYGWKAYGPYEPKRGLRFDSGKLLLDPYARAVCGWEVYKRSAAIGRGDNTANALRSLVVDVSDYDWEGDMPLRNPYPDTIIYEMHVGHFTKNPNSGIAKEKRGTFAGLVEKIPYLKDLGVTAVELMPIHQYDFEDTPGGRENGWGYSTINFFAPHHRYSAKHDPIGAIREFRDTVKAFHKAGIEVILDVVFNHTAEGNEKGPTFSFRGLDNRIYYMLDEDNRQYYSNYTGCGNTVNANHPVVGAMILSSLRYWVEEMHVDGFRFDLASALTRDITGKPLVHPGVLWAIESDPVLAGTKLIAEAWDAAGLYQVGTFVNTGDHYAEWNGPFRDEVRRFVKGDTNSVGQLASRIAGSPDIYTKPNREPNLSVHFITCHDGFTLNDLVSYNQKHNTANGEDNRDGTDANFSWNCGEEGPTENLEIEALRLRQIKNFLTILFVSHGTPMLLMGDEVRRTQNGNNNAYCHDNDLVWFDWDAVGKNQDLLHFLKELIAITQPLEVFRQERELSIDSDTDRPHINFHGVNLGKPDYTEYSRSLAFTLGAPHAEEILHVMLNAYWDQLHFELPALEYGWDWCSVLDTSREPPNDIVQIKDAVRVTRPRYTLAARSAAIVFARRKESQ